MVLFGDGIIRCGGKSYSVVPKKRLIKECAIRAPTSLVNEFKTSKVCPYHFTELETVSVTEQSRIRQCKTVNETPCSLNHDRDASGCVNICQKGIFEMLKQPLMGFLR